MTVHVIGAGLAGSECAWQIAERGIPVFLHEMRPQRMTKAHKTSFAAELVCSNSFRGAALSNAVGLLKSELLSLNSLIMNTALDTQVPAGGCLAVDRDRFSQQVHAALEQHPNIDIIVEELDSVPTFSQHSPCVLATGPLTSPSLARAIETLLDTTSFAFYDAISPIVYAESLDHSVIFRQSRYDKGDGDDYLNIPLNQEQYLTFVQDVQTAATYTGNEAVENEQLENLKPFEGCMPVEDIVARGVDTLRHGPFKPKGLRDPSTGTQPHAVLQLRQDNREATLWSMVGMQTRMKRADQERIFKKLPGLEEVEFARFGSVHRNTFINSPACLNATLELRNHPGLFLAGQITGVEGYVESTAAGLVAGINAARRVEQKDPICLPAVSATASLMNYISDPNREDFQPMNINFGIIENYFAIGLGKKMTKKDRRLATSKQALAAIEKFALEMRP